MTFSMAINCWQFSYLEFNYVLAFSQTFSQTHPKYSLLTILLYEIADNDYLISVSGFIGMALSYGLSLNMSLVFSIQNQCTLANYIISVERLNQYMHIPSEAPEVIEENRPPVNWPDVGKVDIRDLQVKV